MLRSLLSNFMTSSSEFSLQDVEGFPYEEFEDQKARYMEAERWFTGAALDDQPEVSDNRTDLYPMRINPVPGALLKHAYILLGETEDDGRPQIVSKLIPRDVQDDSQKKAALKAEDALNQVWWENNGRALLIENAIISQIYGGCIFKVQYVPWEEDGYGGWRTIPIRITRINPKQFIAIPDGDDMYRLSEAWMVREIDGREAKRWGYPETDMDAKHTYWEHWTPEVYECRIDNAIAVRRVSGGEVPLGGANPFGFVPFVYIPHIRIGNFLGVDAHTHLAGYTKEMNLRIGDFGDAVNDDSHPVIGMTNVSGTPQVMKLSSWLEVVNLGSRQGLATNEGDPDLFQVGTQRASPSMKDLLHEIYSQFRRDGFIPPVADGEDEGSQRSGMTLAMRFWPLTSHANTERFFWTPGFDLLQTYLLKIMQKKNLSGITKEMASMRMKQRWAPMLPRDREVDVNEWVARAGAMLGSIEHLLELTGDVEDVQEERERLLQWKRDLLAIETEAAMKQQEAQAETQMELAETQAESQLELAKEQAKAQPKVTPQGGGSSAKTKPAPKSSS